MRRLRDEHAEEHDRSPRHEQTARWEGTEDYEDTGTAYAVPHPRRSPCPPTSCSVVARRRRRCGPQRFHCCGVDGEERCATAQISTRNAILRALGSSSASSA